MITLAGIWWYGWAAGGEIPVIRALVLATVYFGAQLTGRKLAIWRGVVLSAGLLIAADIKVVAELSFWLTMAAFVGVVSSQNFKWWIRPWWIGVWVWPLLVMIGGKVNWLSPVTGLLAGMLAEVIVVLGFWGSVLGFEVGLWLLLPWLKLLNWLVELTGGWGWEWKMSTITVLGVYLFLTAITIKIDAKNTGV